MRDLQVVRHPDDQHDVFIDPALSILPNLVTDQFQKSLASGLIHLYAADDCPFRTLPFSESSDVKAESMLFLCESTLANKPGPSEVPKDLTTKPARDVFGGEFGPGEEVARYHRPDDEYRVVLNLHSVVSEHFMMLPRAFRPQSSDLKPEDLLMAFKIVESYHRAGREMLCFFNGGNRSGASQPHLHLQFAPFQKKPPAPVVVARALKDKMTETPCLLPLAHVNYVCPLENLPSIEHETQLSETLYSTYQNLLNTMRLRLGELQTSSTVQDPHEHSYNLLLTHDSMHLIPRARGTCRIPKRNESNESRLYSLNALAYIGLLLVFTEEDVEDWKEHTIEKALVKGSYDRTGWDNKSAA